MTDRSDWAWWRERRPTAERVHFDTAAAGRASVATLRAMADHAEREAVLGAYVAQAEAEPVLAEGRAALAQLIGVPAGGLAFVESAHAALDALLDAWPFQPGDSVAVVPGEWGPNLHAFQRRGLQVVMIDTDADGVLDPAALSRLLSAATGRPALVHLTPVASHRPLVQPAALTAGLCREAGLPLWLDLAQAAGHVDTRWAADAVYGTSRKWLTGPRGVGFLGVASQWWDRLRVDPPPLERSAQPPGTSPVWFLESNEANVAGRVGLCNAVRELTQAGPETVWQRLAAVGSLTRQALDGLPGWQVLDAAGGDVATTALRPRDGQDVTVTRTRLLAEHGIVSTAAATVRAPLEMTSPLLRISPHVDCSADDLDVLRKALSAI